MLYEHGIHESVLTRVRIARAIKYRQQAQTILVLSKLTIFPLCVPTIYDAVSLASKLNDLQ